ncbi:aminodeoxychorismate synthase component I [Beijerinckia sp. L45]|uniref:aminodeoxychorismate synthase component I n=1 Tax=Beijerinckia sp. L45 TaxID=1641855 RepID=UPI00131C218A|nr:aminodeoxychorismate synthase component I [Beijerinckia sp. L45]
MWTREIAWIEPIKAAAQLADLPGLSLLDSAMPHSVLGRYSTLAADPFGLFHVEDGRAFWNNEAVSGAPLDALRVQLSRYRCEPVDGLPPFQGGAIGVLSYEFGWALDQGPTRHHEPVGRTVHLGFYDLVVAFDHEQHRCWIIASGWPAPSRAARQRRADGRIAAFLARLDHPTETPHTVEPLRWTPDMTPVMYRAAVDTVKGHIRAGDIYQANIAQRFSAAVPPTADSLQLYRQLRAANPAPFAAYLRCGATTILSSSPERLVRTVGRTVETRPIKGTARRAADPAADTAAAQALLASEKDRAENVMIVDLLRNDLARVCVPTSVAVPVLCGLESYAGLHHLVSVVIGALRDGCDALDLIGATFPGGSITGAPKLRAMEIIADIEGRPRGVYCGAIGAIGFDGDVDFNIAIRTIVIEHGVATFQTGGGITILSDPDAEYEETLTKAQRIFAAFAEADAPSADIFV